MKNVEKVVLSNKQYDKPAFGVSEFSSETGFAGSGAFSIKMTSKAL